MKYCLFIVASLIGIHFSFSQKVILNELGCQISKSGKEHIAKVVEYEYKFFESFLEVPRNTEIRASIYGDHDAFKLTQKIVSKTKTNSAFYTRKQIFINYRKKDKEQRVLNVVAHESSHFIIDSDSYGKPPKWINEGLAEYFEQATINNLGKVEINPPKKYVEFIHTNFEKNNIKIKKIINWSSIKWKNVNKNKLYSYKVSWAIINYFLKTNKEALLKEIILEVKKNKTKSKNILRRLYPNGIDQLQTDIEVYYKTLYANLNMLKNDQDNDSFKEQH